VSFFAEIKAVYLLAVWVVCIECGYWLIVSGDSIRRRKLGIFENYDMIAADFASPLADPQ